MDFPYLDLVQEPHLLRRRPLSRVHAYMPSVGRMHTGTRVSVRVLCECVRRVRKETHTVRRGKEEVEEHKRGFGLKPRIQPPESYY